MVIEELNPRAKGPTIELKAQYGALHSSKGNTKSRRALYSVFKRISIITYLRCLAALSQDIAV
jgi:hypothetical protein